MAAIAQEAEGLVIATECNAKAMLEDLGWKYRAGVGLDSVGTFQKAWNRILPYVRNVDGVVLPSKNGGLLTVDKLYGSQSATAAQNFLKARLPARAADMPAWYAANQGEVSAMCPPAPPPQAEVVPQPIQAGPEPVIPPVIAAPAPPPPPSPEPEELPIVVVNDPEQVKADLAQGPVQVVAPEAPGLTPAVPQQLPEARIVAQPRRGDVPVLAIAAGLVAVAGVAGFWMYRRRA